MDKKDSRLTDWSQCPQVEMVPGRVGGVPVFKNTRLPVSHLFIVLRDGGSVADFIDWYEDSVSEENIKAVLAFLKDDLEREWTENWKEGKYTEFATVEASIE